MRTLAILLFSFELMVPVLWHNEYNSISAEQKSTAHFNEHKQSIDLLSQLIFEVTGSEEREGKDDFDFLSVSYIEVFNELQKFIPAQITWSLPKDRFDIQPSLFTLHRVLLI